MGKRTGSTLDNHDAGSRDYWPTWAPEAVAPLLPYLAPATRYCEPCAGGGHLIDHLTGAGHICVEAWDLVPMRRYVQPANALDRLAGGASCYITNPPWSRWILHALIVHLASHRPTWLLFDSDWMHTRQAAPYMPLLHKTISVGRIKWLPETKSNGKDNCSWYLFDAAPRVGGVEFIGRTVR